MEKVKEIINKIKNNKRVLYILGIFILVLFCLALNITFSLFTTGANSLSANITVGDLDYRMEINDGDPSAVVGNKDKSNYIIGDRVLLSKADMAEQFDISLISLNNFDTKYEIIYNFCEDVSCSKYINAPEGVDIYYGRNNPEVNGVINGSSAKVIGLVVHNTSSVNYYIEIGLNVGYKNNDLALKNQITEEFSSNKLDGNLTVLAYIDGNEADTFPTGSNYETAITCSYEDGSTSSVNAILVYAASGWELNIHNIDEYLTTCRVDFTTVLQVTYSILSTNLKCANLNTGLADSDAVIKYTGNCTLTNDSSITGSGNWRIKFTNGGTLTFSGQIYVDIWLVGGGGGGATGSQGVHARNGGAGGSHGIYNRVALNNKTTYQVVVGAGGNPGASGGTSSLGGIYTAGGGATNSYSTAKCSFENKTSGCTYTDNAYSGLYGGAGGVGGCDNVAGNCGSATAGVAGGGKGNGSVYGWGTAGEPNTGGGGGGRFWTDTANGYAAADGLAGGSGLVAIRNAF